MKETPPHTSSRIIARPPHVQPLPSDVSADTRSMAWPIQNRSFSPVILFGRLSLNKALAFQKEASQHHSITSTVSLALGRIAEASNRATIVSNLRRHFALQKGVKSSRPCLFQSIQEIGWRDGLDATLSLQEFIKEIGCPQVHLSNDHRRASRRTLKAYLK